MGLAWGFVGKELKSEFARWKEAAFQDVLEAKPCFGGTLTDGFSVYIRQRIFAVRTEAFGDVVLVPGEDSDGLADRDKVQAKPHLSAEPDVIPDNAVFGGVGATFPNLTVK